MKKIINRKLYDTSTAAEIATHSNGRGWSDFNYIEETLYRKKTGEFFLHGAGGASSKYGEWYGNMKVDGEQIIPLTYDEAADWAEKFMDADAYQQVFGEITDDESLIQISFRIPAPAVDKLRRAASRTGKTQQEILADLISTLEV